jgi:hypothetical protein
MGIGYGRVLENKKIEKNHKAKLIREMLHAKKSLGIDQKPMEHVRNVSHFDKPSAPMGNGSEGRDDNVVEKGQFMRQRAEKIQKRKREFENLNKKTKKGQPIMRYHVDRLLEKIKDSTK